jgi:serine/threonine-protein kinase
LLTILAEAGPRGVSRDRILGLLWSESDADRARQALTQSLYHARRALEQDDLFAGAADLMLNAEVITSDIGEFEGAIERGELQRAADLYTGPFLDGFFVTGAPEFERWVEAQRTRFQQQYSDALDHLAAAAEARTDHRDAVQWRKRLAALDPLNSRIALDLIRTLAAAGDRAGAIRHAQVHETLLREELGAAPNPAIVELADRLREERSLCGSRTRFPFPRCNPMFARRLARSRLSNPLRPRQTSRVVCQSRHGGPVPACSSLPASRQACCSPPRWQSFSTGALEQANRRVPT